MQNLRGRGEPNVPGPQGRRQQFAYGVERLERKKAGIGWDRLEQWVAVARHPEVYLPDLPGRVDSGVNADRGQDVHRLDVVRVSLRDGVVVQVFLLAEPGEPSE